VIPKDSPNLDLLRAIAVSLVVFSHLGPAMGLGNIESVGRVGVAIFFVHTALVLMLSLERSGGAAAPFFIRRLLRIYPLAGVIVLLVATGHWLGGIEITVGAVAANLLLVQNLTGHESIIGPLWSLPYEVQMYLLLPLIFAAVTTTRGAVRAAWLLAGSWLLVLALWAVGWSTQLVLYIPCFLPGVLAFTLMRRAPGRANPVLLFALVGAGLLAVVSLVRAGAQEAPLLWILCFGLGLAIPRCRELALPLIARWAKLVATYSYSIYLTHTFAIRAGFELGEQLPPFLQWAACAFMLVASARVGYRWVEKPGIEIGIRLAGRRRAQTVAP
jgi:peptidoglycan/LPS O-acetylase OafA/YrhL